MSGRRLCLVLTAVLWMASIAVGSADPAPAFDDTLPDPFARRTVPLFSLAIAAFLIAIGAGALWLRRSRPVEPEDPGIVMLREPVRGRVAPAFYDGLRQRETALEHLEDRSPGRSRPKVVELPVGDRPPAEEDR